MIPVIDAVHQSTRDPEQMLDGGLQYLHINRHPWCSLKTVESSKPHSPMYAA